MKNILLSSLAALATAAFGLASTAYAAPAGPASVDATVNQLREQGFDVIVSRIGTAAPEQCRISSVRPGQTFTRTDSDLPGGVGDRLVTTVISKTVYVDVTC